MIRCNRRRRAILNDPADIRKRLAKELTAKTWKDFAGHCYEAAFKFVVAYPRYRLCHGVLPNELGGHAWAEDDDGNVVDLTQPELAIERWRFYEILDVDLEAEYDAETAMALAVESKHFGPWN